MLGRETHWRWHSELSKLVFLTYTVRAPVRSSIYAPYDHQENVDDPSIEGRTNYKTYKTQYMFEYFSHLSPKDHERWTLTNPDSQRRVSSPCFLGIERAS